MKIEGIENISNINFTKVIVEFILDNYEGEDIEVEEIDSNTFSINGDKYAIYTEEEEDDLIDSFNEEQFSSAIMDIPANWRAYINKNKWIDDYGASDFGDYWEGMDFDELLTYVVRINGVNIYRLD